MNATHTITRTGECPITGDEYPWPNAPVVIVERIGTTAVYRDEVWVAFTVDAETLRATYPATTEMDVEIMRDIADTAGDEWAGRLITAVDASELAVIPVDATHVINEPVSTINGETNAFHGTRVAIVRESGPEHGPGAMFADRVDVRIVDTPDGVVRGLIRGGHLDGGATDDAWFGFPVIAVERASLRPIGGNDA